MLREALIMVNWPGKLVRDSEEWDLSGKALITVNRPDRLVRALESSGEWGPSSTARESPS